MAITASSPMVETHGAFVIGLVSGALVFYGSKLLLMAKARHGELLVFYAYCVGSKLLRMVKARDNELVFYAY